MRPHHPWYWAAKNAWFVAIGDTRHRLGQHPEGVPPPKKRQRGDPPPKPPGEIEQAYYRLMAADPAKLPKASDLKVCQVADLSASGATRVSGSLNFKERYAPAFPRVETVHTSPGRVVTPAELETLGVVAPPEKADPVASGVSRCPEARRWPNYQRCVENAPPARGGGRPDISRADFTFCLLAIDWGWGVEETAARLMQESNKALENGEAYALRTARNAAAAIERRGGRQR